MNLNINETVSLNEPSAEQVAELVASLPVEQFAILSRSEGDYIQVYHCRDGSFQLEYADERTGEHHQVVEEVRSSPDVAEAFALYRTGNEDWKAKWHWTRVMLGDCGELEPEAGNPEIEQRRVIALDAIKQAYDTGGDNAVALFVSHHLEQIDASYWRKHLEASPPDPLAVLSILVMQSHWGDEDGDGLGNFDFTLPEEITNYVICVRFTDNGEIDEITMES